MTADAQAAIAEALARMPDPSVLVDAGPEVWVAWRLVHPFDLTRDAAQAQAALAARLDADWETAKDLGALIPIGGGVRSWNGTNPDFIEIVVAEPERRYDVEQLLTHPTGGERP